MITIIKTNIFPKVFYVIPLVVSIILFTISADDKTYLMPNINFNLIPSVDAQLLENCSPSTVRQYIANAGQDQNVSSGDLVTLDPTGSFAYELYWRTAGEYSILIPDPRASEFVGNPPIWTLINVTFVAPYVDKPTVMPFQLIGQGSDFEYFVCDSLNITVNPSSNPINYILVFGQRTVGNIDNSTKIVSAIVGHNSVKIEEEFLEEISLAPSQQLKEQIEKIVNDGINGIECNTSLTTPEGESLAVNCISSGNNVIWYIYPTK